jgi:hypothetical protein
VGLAGAAAETEAIEAAEATEAEATEVLILDARSEIVFDFWVPRNQKWAHPFVNFLA